MQYDSAGDPISGLRWTHRTRSSLADYLGSIGLRISATSVGTLLKKMGFSLRLNQKKIQGGKKTAQNQKERDEQFGYIRSMRDRFDSRLLPVISVDTKKKELIGNFKNNGVTWCRSAEAVNDHDFPSQSQGKAIPYGVYDVRNNTGIVNVGVTHDTPQFAADSIEKWWRCEGKKRYPQAKHLLILADNGGSNASDSNVWKYALYKKLCMVYGITVSVCHYPTGASKWNPIEHRFFSEISKNWEGVPLRNLEIVLKYIRTTKTKTGLKIRAFLNKKKYKTGEKITKENVSGINMKYHKTLPKWNYTIKPENVK
jgi:hypothetical protein